MTTSKSLALAAVLAGLAGPALAEPIVLGTSPSLLTGPIIIAEAEGYFEEAGVEIEYVKFTSGRAALEALIGGQLDLASMAEYPPVIASLTEQPFMVVSEIASYSGNRLISTKEKFSTLEDLAGMKVGTTRGTNVEFFTEMLLEKAGVEAEIVSVAPPDIVPALARGDIDAGVMFPDFYAGAEKALGDDYADYISDAYISYFVLSATPEMVETRGEDLKGFLSALVKAEAYIDANPEASQQAISDATEGAMPLELIQTIWPNYDFAIALTSGLNDLFLAEGAWVTSKGLIPVEMDEAKIRAKIATEPLASVDPSLGSFE